MDKMLISVPEDISHRFRDLVPPKQRSKVIAELIKVETERREQLLYECAMAVEADAQLNEEMEKWDITLQDGFDE